MKIAIFSENSSTNYSGGRYHSFMMAEAMAHAGHIVHYITNVLPIFYNDFSTFDHHQDVKICISPSFWFGLPEGLFDFVFIIPSLTHNMSFFLKVLYFAEKRKARLALLNFETPNWYNSLSPVKRKLSLWRSWELIASRTSLILSSSKEGDRYARTFFDNSDNHSEFDYCYPSINDIVADKVNVKKEKKIIIISRFKMATHKGSSDINRMLCTEMEGYTLTLILGYGDIPIDVLDSLRKEASKYNIEIDLKYKLSDHDKFKEIKSASLMLFPSTFEGFGYPPIEAQYCNVPCIAFDLPVLKEVNGDGLIYVKYGDYDQFRAVIGQVLNSEKDYSHLKENIYEVASFEIYTKRLDAILRKTLNGPTIDNIPFPYFKFIGKGCLIYLITIGNRFYELLFPLLKLAFSITFPLYIIGMIFLKRILSKGISLFKGR